MFSFIKKINILKLILIILVSVSFGSLVTWWYFSQNLPVQPLGAIRLQDAATPLIRPLLAYNTPETLGTSPLKETLKNIITSYQKDSKINTVSVYFRDLNTGKWFGINQDETYIPASLFKVPLMISFLKDAENNPAILSKTVTNDLTEDQNARETIKPLKTIKVGNSYTIEELLRYMIEYSDNNATVLLFNHVNQITLKKVFDDLDIQLPTNDINSDFISVTGYSLFFRVLYNATYLNTDMSEKGMEMLSKIDFADGLRKGIPSTITVADKFGEYYLLDQTPREYQLHDCGIVYHPKHPYLLCLMSKGASFNNLKKALVELSKATYTIINK